MSLRRAADRADRTDRRQEDGLAFDPATGRLRLGTHTRDLPAGAGNREVLDAYVELTAWSRGDRVAEVVEVRQADIEALAAALDLDASGLAEQVEQVLGATRADAQRLVARLRDTRLIGGITKAAISGVVAGALVAGCATTSGSTDASVAPRPPEATTPTTTSVGTEPVELIPPATIDAEPMDAPQTQTQLIPPAEVDQPR